MDASASWLLIICFKANKDAAAECLHTTRCQGEGLPTYHEAFSQSKV